MPGAMDHTSSDHPVFKRFSRQQQIVRRRNIGYQSLVFEFKTKDPRCKQCARVFNNVWKEYLCHVCGLFVCLPCSNVLERERTIGRIQFVRACVDCTSMLNKWSDPGLLAEYVELPIVIASSKNQLGLNLADMLRLQKHRRHAVLVVLQQLGMPVDPATTNVDDIGEDEWVGTTHNDAQPTQMDPNEPTIADKPELLESAQHLIQQCFEVYIPELPISQCLHAEVQGSRKYPLYYDSELEIAQAPILTNEKERTDAIARYDLLNRELNSEELQLVCELAAKEMECSTSFISVVEGELTHPVAFQPTCKCAITDRSQTFCAYALASPLPFLVRDASLDIRFRNFDIVRGADNIRFFCSHPIFAENRTTVLGSLCVMDNKPHKHVTTMQYSIMNKLAEVVGSLWQQMLVAG